MSEKKTSANKATLDDVTRELQKSPHMVSAVNYFLRNRGARVFAANTQHARLLSSVLADMDRVLSRVEGAAVRSLDSAEFERKVALERKLMEIIEKTATLTAEMAVGYKATDVVSERVVKDRIRALKGEPEEVEGNDTQQKKSPKVAQIKESSVKEEPVKEQKTAEVVSIG